jgi:DNA-binding MarR family transcriptional regulator
MLGRAYSRLGHQIVEGVARAGFPQRPAHSNVFAHIEPDGTRLGVLAARAIITAPAMKSLVDDLEGSGYVRRVPDPTDRRAKLVVPTERGLRALEAGASQVVDIERRLEDLLGRSGLEQLRAALGRIVHDL